MRADQSAKAAPPLSKSMHSTLPDTGPQTMQMPAARLNIAAVASSSGSVS